ncbi:hypothetical protein OAZ80_01505 [bacterium]|nr:hypothetical protein [bacterium]
MPNDLGNLLDALRDADRTSLMLLVGIIAIYGLRPHEVAQMIKEDGHLKIRPGGKRNKATRGKKQKNRLVLPFDVPGREGEGERLVMLRRTGTIRFPQAVLNRINEVEEKGFKKAIAALEERGLGERLKVGTVWAFKASKPWP